LNVWRNSSFAHTWNSAGKCEGEERLVIGMRCQARENAMREELWLLEVEGG
jgi:hypothetical protein